MSFSPLNEIATLHHDMVINQRIFAINKAMDRLNAEARQVLDSISALPIQNTNSKCLIDFVNKKQKAYRFEFDRIKKDISIVRNCNYLFIQIHPILCESDLRRYLDFMRMSYRTVERDFIKFCSNGDLVIESYQQKTKKIINEINSHNNNGWVCYGYLNKQMIAKVMCIMMCKFGLCLVLYSFIN